MDIQLFKCFGTSADTGNEAIVVKNDVISLEKRILFAKQQNKTCVFVDSIQEEIFLDYYYPHKRSPLCMHATLAAAHDYFNNNTLHSQVEFITSINKQKIKAIKIDDNIFLEVQEIQCPDIKLDKSLIRQFLNINPDNINSYAIKSVGSPKLLVELSNKDLLNNLVPDLELINKWSTENKLNGCYVYVKLVNNNYIGRNFNHIDPSLEDIATGVAAGALTASLKREINLHQGINLNNHCLIRTKYLSNSILIGGNVQFVKLL